MAKERTAKVVLSSGCRSLQLVPGFSSPALSSCNDDDPPRKGPFSGLVICVTGLSKEARKQVQEATEKMGGQYSPDLHPQCTHLVVQSCEGRKFEHALKHGVRQGLHVVSLAWFIHSAKLNDRLDESAFSVSRSSIFINGEVASPDSFDVSDEHVGLPSLPEEGKAVQQQSSRDECRRQSLLFRGFVFYMDHSVSEDLQMKVIAAATKEGASFADSISAGCGVSHVICDRSSFLNYVGSVCNLVTPLWLLKSLKERSPQRMVQFSADLARNLALVIDSSKERSPTVESRVCSSLDSSVVQTERQELVKVAKAGVRRRRGPRKQPCRTLPRPITSATLLDCVCWSVTDSPLTAKLYVERSPGSVLDVPDATPFFDAHENGNTSGSESELFTRPFRESERQEVIYAGVFMTILYPIDRFVEMGPSSRTYFNERGFSRQEILEHIYAFYQEFLSEDEVKVAIHTDSRHADKLRILYSSRESIEQGHVEMRRFELLGGRRSFEGLKRTSRENTGQVYELCLGS